MPNDMGTGLMMRVLKCLISNNENSFPHVETYMKKGSMLESILLNLIDLKNGVPGIWTWGY